MDTDKSAAPSMLLRLGGVEQRTGLKRSTIYKLIQERKFPQPVKLTERCVAWDSLAVDEWIQQRIKSGGAK